MTSSDLTKPVTNLRSITGCRPSRSCSLTWLQQQLGDKHCSLPQPTSKDWSSVTLLSVQSIATSTDLKQSFTSLIGGQAISSAKDKNQLTLRKRTVGQFSEVLWNITRTKVNTAEICRVSLPYCTPDCIKVSHCL